MPFAAVLAALCVAASPAVAQACTGADDIPSAGSIEQARATTLCLINEMRASHGLRRLRENPRLRLAAERHSSDMDSRGYFDHVSPDGRTPVARIRSTGYLRRANSWSVAENIGWGTTSLSTPAAMMETWMESAGHRRNILTPRFRDIGIGIGIGTPEGDWAGGTYTTNFGVRR